MKAIRKTAAALTALTMAASASAALFPETDIFSLSTAFADDAADYAYSVSVSNETYDLSSLKTLAYYKANELYKCTVPVDKVNDGSIDNNYVAEVKINLDKNIGFFLAQMVLDFDEDLTFVGCSYYQKDGTKTVSGFDSIEDGPVSVSAYYNKVMILLKDKSNVTETGELLTLLFALPEKPEAGKAYSIALSQKTKIVPWDDSITNQTVGKTAGSITVKAEATPTPTPSSPTPTPASPTPTPSSPTPTPASPTPTPASPTPTPASPTPTPSSPTPTPSSPTPTPASPTPTPSSPTPTPASPTPTPASPTPTPASPTPTPSSPTPTPSPAMPEIDLTSLTTPHKLAEGASIDLDIPSEIISSGTKEVELKVNLSDFDAKDEYFDYAGLALKLPEGFKLKEVKKSDIVKSVTPMSATTAAVIQAKTGFKADTEYYMLAGIDTSKSGKNEELCTLVLTVPDNAKTLNEVTAATLYGRSKDGKVTLLDNGSEGTIYTVTTADVIKGVRGDFDLDGKVSQVDATFMLRYLLESSMAKDKDNADVVYDLIGKDLSEEFKNLPKETIFRLSQSLSDVDGSEGNKSFVQTDATFILRALLTNEEIDNAFWDKFIIEK